MRIEAAQHASLFVALFALCSSTPTMADEAVTQGYVMTVYSDLAYGQKVLDGAETKAIRKLSRNGEAKVKYLEGQTNLCVAYTKTKQVGKATVACDSAIESSLAKARRLGRTKEFGRQSAQVANTGRAIALTNRGVLHALAGEHEEARAKFELAIELQSTEQSAKSNLALLEQRDAKKST